MRRFPNNLAHKASALFLVLLWGVSLFPGLSIAGEPHAAETTVAVVALSTLVLTSADSVYAHAEQCHCKACPGIGDCCCGVPNASPQERACLQARCDDEPTPTHSAFQPVLLASAFSFPLAVEESRSVRVFFADERTVSRSEVPFPPPPRLS